MYDEMKDWMDSILEQDIPEPAAAFCFNLYEDGGGKWSMELIASSRFDADDEDWACDEAADFGTRDNPFCWAQDEQWDKILEAAAGALTKYLKEGRYAEVLKSKAAVAVGFTDGNLEIIYTSGG